MRSRIFALLVAFVFCTAPLLRAGSQETNAGVKLRWRNGSIIRYTFNSNFAPNNNSDLVRAAIRDAVASLTAPMGATPAIQFQEVAQPTTVNTIGIDNVNLITFTSGTSLPSGVIAQASIFFTAAGEIGEVDMQFDTNRQFRTNSRAANVFDIQAIGLHEAGHWIGLGHSGILAASMSPFGDSGEFPARELQTDDIVVIRAIYGPSTAAIRGLVSSGGAPVKGAHVVATEAATGLTHSSTFSEADGTYRLPVLAAGSYRLLVEPLDQPVQPGNVPDAFQGGNVNFQTAFLANPVTVGSSDVTGINFAVTAQTSANIQGIGVLQSNGSVLAGGSPSSIRRGADVSFGFLGQSLQTSGQARFSSPRVSLLSQSNASDPRFIIANLRVTADAAMGPTDIYLGTSAFVGGLVITANPVVPSNGVVDGAAFNQNTTGPHYAPGSMISIFGTDVAEFQASASAIPLPTQLGGISVEIGGQLAPLFFVSPTQVNAMIPYEITGNTTTVRVLAGPTSESAPITIQLGSATPRLFQLNAQSDGAVQNNSRNFELVAAGTPAAAGDIITIYLTGLGALEQDIATGIASTALRTRVNPTVTIGGQNAELFYSGLTPGLVGLYQVSVRVPAGLAAGKQPVVVRGTNGSSNTVFTYVR